jgi:hypothetical protein
MTKDGMLKKAILELTEVNAAIRKKILDANLAADDRKKLKDRMAQISQSVDALADARIQLANGLYRKSAAELASVWSELTKTAQGIKNTIGTINVAATVVGDLDRLIQLAAAFI